MASLLQALDHAERAIAVLDKERRVVYYNRRYQEMWGFPAEFLERKPHIEDCIRWACRNGVYPEDQEEELVARRLDHLTARTPLIPLETPRRDGTLVEGYAAPIPDGGWVLSFRDMTRWQQMLAELQTSEARYRAILEAMQDFVLICSQNRRIEYMNPALVRHLGRDATGNRCHEALFHMGETCPWCPAIFGPPDATEIGEAVVSLGNEERTYHLLRVPLPPLAKEEEFSPPSLVVLRDITEQAKRQRELRDLLRLQEQILDSAGEGILVTDEDLRCQIWNPAMERCTGVSADRALGLPITRALGPGGDNIVALIREALKGQEVSANFVRYTHQGTDTESWVTGTFTPRRDTNGHIKGVVGIVRDVTRQKLDEEARRRKDLIFRALVEHAHAVPWEFDPRTKRFTYVGPQATEITGFPPRAWSDPEFWRRLVHPDDRIQAEEAAKQGIRESGSARVEYRIVRADGSIRWVLSLMTVFRNSEGPDRLLGFLIDVTEEKREAVERRRFEVRLQQAERMESLGVLAGGVAHDFNNLLTPILAHAEILEYQLPPGDPLRNNAREIVRAAERAADLAKQILAFSRETGGELRPLKLAPLVKETVKFLRSGLPATAVLREEIRITDEAVRTEPTKIHQIVMNLCVNAVQAMEGKGTVEVGAAIVEGPDLPSFSEPPEEAARYARLWVSDTGPGIPDEILAKIFDPFFTTKKDQGGTGMGLANVKRIVNELGGAIQVTSQEGTGARFDVYLPLIDEGGHRARAPLDGPGLRRGTERILLVDDERAIVDMLAYILGELGYQVLGVEKGAQAIQILERGPQSFDVVLVDLMMPEVTGFEVIQQARSLRADLPVILCSGHPISEQELRQRRISSPAVVLPKPISMASLSEALRKVLDRQGAVR
ncbi:MAG: PAS domain S-box protein [Deltaproteobacteria bacterium]|nr:PAS domain S-box protein [Deltaproteobacteria bacterium]